MWTAALGGLSDGGIWAAAATGPIFLTLLLVFVSGIPLLERSADERFGRDAEYLAYRAKTSPLLPLPHFLYAALPFWIKVLLLERSVAPPKAEEAPRPRSHPLTDNLVPPAPRGGAM